MYFKILEATELDYNTFGNSNDLTPLGGSTGSNYCVGLGDWQYNMSVEVYNHNVVAVFDVALQPEERNDKLKAYSGYDVEFAAKYGCYKDQSEDLLEFCDYSVEILDELKAIARDAAHRELYALMLT